MSIGYHYAQNYASIVHQGLTSLALVTNCCVITILMLLFPNTFNMCNCVFTLIVHSQSLIYKMHALLLI